MKPIKIKEKTQKYKKHNIVISAIKLPFGEEYEVGVFDLDNDFAEIDMANIYTMEDCMFYFNKFVKKYVDKKEKVAKEDTPIPKRYIKFAEDYKEIYDNCAAMADMVGLQDGNASNLDTCVVSIGKRVKNGFLMAALKKYNLKAHLTEGLIYVVVPYTQYQGDGNTWQVEYMSKLFQQKGYESFVNYVID